MPGIINKIKSYARSPQGQRAIRRQTSDPRRRAQAKSLLGRLRGGRTGGRRY